MKTKIIPILATILCLSITAGCQQPPSPPAYTCPPATYPGTNYTEINPPASNTVAASITGTTYKWTPPSVGAWCLIVQSWALPVGATPPDYQASVPSNIAQATTTNADPVVDLSWTAPAITSVYPSYTYIASYAPATLVGVPLAPPLNPPTTSVSKAEPIEPQMPAPKNLVARNASNPVVVALVRYK